MTRLRPSCQFIKPAEHTCKGELERGDRNSSLYRVGEGDVLSINNIKWDAQNTARRITIQTKEGLVTGDFEEAWSTGVGTHVVAFGRTELKPYKKG